MKLPVSHFDWDAGNQDKCRKHGLTIADVEHVFARAETLIMPDLKNSAVEPRFLAIGRTASGRLAFVVFTPREQDSAVSVRPISARFMHQKEIRKYAQEISRAED